MHIRLIAAATAAVFAVSGCANMTETQKDTATGAAIGTAAGAAIGAIASGGKGAAIGAGIGAAAGAGGGYLWSKRMQEQKRAMEEATRGTGVTVTQTPNNELKLDIPSDISFDTGKSQIKPQMRPVLDQFAYGLKGNPAAQKRFQAYARAVLQPVFSSIGWNARPDDAAPVQLLRTTLIRTLAALEDAAVIAEVRRRFAAGPDDVQAMPPALRTLITAIIANKADAATWDRLHAMARAEKTPLIKDELYGLLGIAEDKVLAQRALELALTDEPGATNSAGMISAVAGQHPDMAFDFAVANRAKVETLVDGSSQARYYPGLAGGSADRAMIGKLRAFAEAHIPASARNATETSIANIENRIRVREQRIPAIVAWLEKNGG